MSGYNVGIQREKLHLLVPLVEKFITILTS